jgi:Pilin accessory protein (PilO)
MSQIEAFDAHDEEERGFGAVADEPAARDDRPASRPSGSSGVVRIKGKEYAVGLDWFQIEDIPSADREAKAMATRDTSKADFYCARITGTPQFGLGQRSHGHRSGQLSLAAAVADNRHGSWLGCFAVEGGFYLIAVRDDGIYPGTDKFFVSEDEARSNYDQLYEAEWNERFAPASFGLEGSKDLPINSLLVVKPQVKLRDVAGRSRTVYMLGGLILVGGLVFAGFQYNSYLQRLEVERTLAEMSKNARNPLKQQVEIPPMPWEGRPEGAAFLERCVQAIQSLKPFEFPGWKSNLYGCTGGDGTSRAAVIELVRDGPISSINWISWVREKAGRKWGVSPSGADRAQVTQQLESIPEIKIDVQTARIAEIQRFLLSRFDEMLTKVSLSPGENTEFVSGLKFSFKTQVDPMNYHGVLQNIPALVVSKVTYDPNTWLWSVEGVAYEQHIPKNATKRRK